MPLQIFEVDFDGSGGVILVHHSTISTPDGWTGKIIFTYPLGTEHIFRSPEEILEWERKIEIETGGCECETSFDVDEEQTTVTIEIPNASSKIDVTTRMTLVGMVESVKTYTIPMLMKGGERKRFSLVTARSNIDVNRTRVIVHLPPDQIISNYLPLENVTVMPGGSAQQSVFWSFGEGGASEARIYVEFGTKGKLGRLMILVIILFILGVALAALKFLLILDEESLTY